MCTDCLEATKALIDTVESSHGDDAEDQYYVLRRAMLALVDAMALVRQDLAEDFDSGDDPESWEEDVEESTEDED
jgi:hypothetical protein